MAQNQLGSRLIQPTASWSRGLSWPRSLGWAYPGHGLPWTWKCSLMHSIVVRDFAEEVNKCCACSLFNCIPDLHSPETRGAVAGKWERESRKYCLNFTSSICWNISFIPPDWSLKKFSLRFPHKCSWTAPYSNRDRNINLKEKKNSVKYGGFPTEANRFAVLIAQAIVENHARYKNKLRHPWTGLAAN